MAIFTSAAVAAFFAIEASFFTAAAAFVLNAAVVTAASLGVSYAQRAIAGNQQQPSSATDFFGVQGALAGGGDVPRSFPLGYSVTAGSLVYANTYGGDTATPNAYLAQVIAVSDLPGPRLVEIWIDGELCTLDLAGLQDVGYPVNEYKKDGREHLWIKYYDGTQTTADPVLVSAVSSTDRPYESTRVGTGVAYVICTSLVEETLFTGFPTFKFGLSSVPLYDPSRDDTAGGTGGQRYSDKSTWGGDGDDFPAVQTYNILRGFYYNDIWVYGLQNTSAAQLPAANWIAQIAKCRATIEGEDGPEPAYRSGMQINVDAQPINAIKAFLSACQGRISSIGGFYKMHLGAPDSPTFAFADDDIVSIEPQVYRPFFALSSSVNGIQARYPDPAQGWEYATAPAYYRTDLEAKDGNRRLMASPSFDAVPYPAQVQRLQKSAIEEGQRARTHSIVLPPAYWIVEPGEVGTWTSARNGYVDKQFRLDAGVDKANLDVAMSLTEVDPADFDWNHGGEFRPVTPGPTVIPRPAPQGIAAWFAEAWTLPDASGIGRRPAIRMSWDGNMPGVVGVQYEVRLAADQSDVTKGRTDQLAAGAIIVSQSLLPDTAYQVRGQYLPSAPRDMLWSDWLTATTPDVRMSIAEFDAAVVYQVTTLLDGLGEKIDAAVQRIASIAANQDSRNWLDKKQLRSQLYATAGNASALIEEVRTVAVDAAAAVADLETAVSAEFAGVNATVSEQATAISTLEGYAAAKWAVAIDVGGNVIGLVLVNDSGNISAFTVTVDKFQVAFPGQAGGAAVPVFTIANVGGVAKIALRGDMLVDGAILARMISAGEVQAVHLSAGSVIADKIAAGVVDSTKIAINGVDILNIIAGAATNFDIHAWSANSGIVVTFHDSQFSSTVKSGKALVLLSGDVDYGPGISGSVNLLVDGSTVKSWTVTGAATVTFFWAVAGLSVGSHTFKLTSTSTVNGLTSGGQLMVVDLRR